MRLRKLTIAVAAILALAAFASAQDWRSQGGVPGRLQGVVEDQNGAPIAGATVTLRWAQENAGPAPLTTNKQGEWAYLGLGDGSWNIDISAPGFQTRKLSVGVQGGVRTPPMVIKLAPAVVEKTEQVVKVGGKAVSKETAEAISKGNAALKAAEDALTTMDNCKAHPAVEASSDAAIKTCQDAAQKVRTEKLGEAEQAFTDASKELSDNKDVMSRLEYLYYWDKKFDKSLDYAKKVTAIDPNDTTSWLLIAQLDLQNNNLAEGEAALLKVPDEKVPDATPYLNLGINYYNTNNSAKAEEWFTRAITKNPKLADAYFYRGLSRYNEKKGADAKADFDQYLTLEPDGSNAQTAKEILKAMEPTHRASPHHPHHG